MSRRSTVPNRGDNRPAGQREYATDKRDEDEEMLEEAVGSGSFIAAALTGLAVAYRRIWKYPPSRNSLANGQLSGKRPPQRVSGSSRKLSSKAGASSRAGRRRRRVPDETG